jgi:hypothetical protein
MQTGLRPCDWTGGNQPLGAGRGSACYLFPRSEDPEPVSLSHPRFAGLSKRPYRCCPVFISKGAGEIPVEWVGPYERAAQLLASTEVMLIYHFRPELNTHLKVSPNNSSSRPFIFRTLAAEQASFTMSSCIPLLTFAQRFSLVERNPIRYAHRRGTSVLREGAAKSVRCRPVTNHADRHIGIFASASNVASH